MKIEKSYFYSYLLALAIFLIILMFKISSKLNTICGKNKILNEEDLERNIKNNFQVNDYLPLILRKFVNFVQVVGLTLNVHISIKMLGLWFFDFLGFPLIE